MNAAAELGGYHRTRAAARNSGGCRASVRAWFPDARTVWGSAAGRYRGYHGWQRLTIEPDGQIETTGVLDGRT